MPIFPHEPEEIGEIAGRKDGIGAPALVGPEVGRGIGGQAGVEGDGEDDGEKRQIKEENRAVRPVDHR